MKILVKSPIETKKLEETPFKRKVFGRPVQTLYAKLLRLPQAPRQAALIQSLVLELNSRGFSYHPRTVKRQLLGNIEYVPQALEEALLHWISSEFPAASPLLNDFLQEKAKLEQSEDPSLYVAPENFIRLADAFLYLEKGLSRRQLALRIKEKLQQKGIALGLETLQAALSGKTLKIKKILETQIREDLAAEGFSGDDLTALLEKVEAEGKEEINKQEVGEISPQVDAYRLKSGGLSKRQVALQLQQRLKQKGYVYHLSSLQSVLEGKTKKTRQILLNTLQAIFQEGTGLGTMAGREDTTRPLPGSEGHQYVVSDKINEWVRRLLEIHPDLTRRRLAIQLHQDLRKKNLELSLNTLQWIVAGKAKRAKLAVLETLEGYLQSGISMPEEISGANATKGRPSLARRLKEAHQRLNESEGEEKERWRRIFLNARVALIQRLWQKRQQKALVEEKSAWRSSGRAEEEWTSSYNEPDVSYDVEVSFDRLVS